MKPKRRRWKNWKKTVNLLRYKLAEQAFAKRRVGKQIDKNNNPDCSYSEESEEESESENSPDEEEKEESEDEKYVSFVATDSDFSEEESS